MEQTTPPTNTNSDSKTSNKLWVWLLIIAIPVGILAYVLMNKEVKAPATEPVAMKNEEQTTEPTTEETTSPLYKDGTYTVTGNYISPGGSEEVGVTLVIKDDVVTDATFEGKAERPMSVRFQGEFAAGFKEFVIGKKLDEINITKVSGSSLTPKGFNDAVAKIKAEAKS